MKAKKKKARKNNHKIHRPKELKESMAAIKFLHKKVVALDKNPKYADIKQTKEIIGGLNENAMFAEGLEDALIGYVTRIGMDIVPLYDRTKVIEILMSEDMTEEDAIEHFDYNIIGSYVGEGTPAFATILRR